MYIIILLRKLKCINKWYIMYINYLVSNFEQKYVEKSFEKRDELIKQFVSEFPLESVKKIEPEQYDLDKKQGSLGW